MGDGTREAVSKGTQQVGRSSLKPAPESWPSGWYFNQLAAGRHPLIPPTLTPPPRSNLQVAKRKPGTGSRLKVPPPAHPEHQTPPSLRPGRQVPPSPGSPLHRRRSSCVWKLRPGGRGELGPRLWGHCNHCVFAWATRPSCRSASLEREVSSPTLASRFTKAPGGLPGRVLAAGGRAGVGEGAGPRFVFLVTCECRVRLFPRGLSSQHVPLC